MTGKAPVIFQGFPSTVGTLTPDGEWFLKVHSHRALALAAMLQNGYKPRSLCSASVSVAANAWCE